ncbi:MAG: tetratricopeptide repeat protein, partial [Cyclobacteriaceae bacterium]|nr:tetratricopeptide repeat protein [Cyclobacteriaceae bacterium]
MIKGKYSWILSLMVVILMGTTVSLQAQSRKKKARAEQTKNEQRNLLQAEIIFLEGEKYYMIEDYGKALIFFQKSLELNPDNPACHYKIAQILLLGDEIDKALIYASKALELDPQNKYYYLLNADIYSKQSNFNAAAQIFEDLLGKVEK